ncbi:hypothetical protein P4S72_25035 [Vibrio sp. PP-XX7]
MYSVQIVVQGEICSKIHTSGYLERLQDFVQSVKLNLYWRDILPTGQAGTLGEGKMHYTSQRLKKVPELP